MFKHATLEQKTNALMDIERQWNGHQSSKVYTVGESIGILNELQACLGPQRPLYSRVCKLLNDIIHYQDDSNLPEELRTETA